MLCFSSKASLLEVDALMDFPPEASFSWMCSLSFNTMYAAHETTKAAKQSSERPSIVRNAEP